MGKNIISYASGGLGNILLPLCSCIVLSKKTNRKLVACWEPTFACMATPKDLFSENFLVITKSELFDLEHSKIYGSLSDIQYDSFLFQNDSLNSLSKKKQVLPISYLNVNDGIENIIVYHNNIIPSLDPAEVVFELKQLKWNEQIINEINRNVYDLKIDKSMYGVHIRATDFNDDITFYTKQIENVLKKEQNARFFVTSDSLEWENKISSTFPEKIFSRNKKNYVTKQNDKIDTWSNNIFRDSNSVIDAVVDAHLLSKTNFLIYNPHSSFAQISKYLS